MITKDFADASAELIEVLKYLPQNELNKIPKKLIRFFEQSASINYSFIINPNKTLEEQQLKEKTKDLIAVIYRNYLCSDEERKDLDKKLIENDKQHKLELEKKYNYNNLFENKKGKIVEKDCENKEVKLFEFKESFFSKFAKIIRKILNLK